MTENGKDKVTEVDAKNKSIEKRIKAYDAAVGKSSDSPEGKVAKALSTGAAAVKRMVDAIKLIENHADMVDIAKLEAIEITKHSKAQDLDKERDALIHTAYTGNDISVFKWQTTKLQDIVKPAKSASKSSAYNVAGASVKVISDTIIEVATTGAKGIGDLVKAVYKKISPDDHKTILPKSENPEPDKVKEKIKSTISKMSGKTAKGYDQLNNKGKKLEQKDKKYHVVDAD
tara:strand:+ start:1087 stop:1776 length:690 start_codon:yes stop_codon:yes gene_type:complete